MFLELNKYFCNHSTLLKIKIKMKKNAIKADNLKYRVIQYKKRKVIMIL